jgi:hypothetical protein
MLQDGYIDPLFYLCYRYLFYYLIGQIILLHVAWFLMFIRIGYLLAIQGEAHDLTEHKNGEPPSFSGITTPGEQNGNDKRRTERNNENGKKNN